MRSGRIGVSTAVSVYQSEIRTKVMMLAARLFHATDHEEKLFHKNPLSGHLRRCSDADTTNKDLSRNKDASILSWPTIMGH
eukprot:scaffold2572_cov75-Skeletonema_marinoi.AAC.29